jgi:hypothetical protein
MARRPWLRVRIQPWAWMFFCVCVVLYLGGGLATDWSSVQGILPPVKNQRNWVISPVLHYGSELPSKGARGNKIFLLDSCEIVSTSHPLPPEISWYSFLLEAESTSDHSEAGRIRLIEKYRALIGNRIRILRPCSIMPLNFYSIWSMC